jgi:hypothetical protein
MHSHLAIFCPGPGHPDAAGITDDSLLCPGLARQLPPGYAGIVVVRSASAGLDEPAWCSSATFTELTYWNHDAAPAPSDWQARCLDWLLLADKVRTVRKMHTLASMYRRRAVCCA